MRSPEQWLSWARYVTGREEKTAKADAPEAVAEPSSPQGLQDLNAPASKPKAPSPSPSPRPWVDSHELLTMHMQLHREYGRDPERAVVQAERMIVEEMKQRGFPHRHRDALAVAAKTVDESPAPIDGYELRTHLEDSLHLEAGAISIVQSVAPLAEDAAGRQLYLQVSRALEPLARALQTKINRSLPPSVNLQLLPSSGAPGAGRQDRLARVTGLYDLRLQQAYGTSRLVGWGDLARAAQASLAVEDLSPTMKSLLGPSLSLCLDDLQTLEFSSVNKANSLTAASPEGGPAEEHYVKGVVLEPGVIDRTRTRMKDGTLTEGDTYDAEVVRQACYYYMEHGGFGARLHTKQGGTELLAHEVCLLENYLSDPGAKIGARVLTPGTWVQGWRVYSESLWKDIKAGRIKAFSIGAMTGGVVETV